MDDALFSTKQTLGNFWIFPKVAPGFIVCAFVHGVKQIDVSGGTELGLLMPSGNPVCLFMKSVVYFMCIAISLHVFLPIAHILSAHIGQ